MPQMNNQMNIPNLQNQVNNQFNNPMNIQNDRIPYNSPD